MATSIQVKPAVPITGGLAGLLVGALRGRSLQETLTYGMLGASLAWAGAAAVILQKANQQNKLTATQAAQLAGFIADREQQRQSATGELKDRLQREIDYLQNVLTNHHYQYANGQAVKTNRLQ